MTVVAQGGARGGGGGCHRPLHHGRAAGPLPHAAADAAARHGADAGAGAALRRAAEALRHGDAEAARRDAAAAADALRGARV